MLIIEDYMDHKSREERRKHLRLEESCDIRGGDSDRFHGLLAHYLDTTLPPRKSGIMLCHACNNGDCSNPRHLYWGTAKDNTQDMFEAGSNLLVRENMIRKYGVEGANQKAREACRKGAIAIKEYVWVTNDIEETRIHKNESIPGSWRRGRSPAAHETRRLRAINATQRKRVSGRFV